MKAFYRKQNGGHMKSGKYYVLQDGLTLKAFHPIARTFVDYYLTLNTLLEWQQMDEFLPNTLVPFCSDAGAIFTISRRIARANTSTIFSTRTSRRIWTIRRAVWLRTLLPIFWRRSTPPQMKPALKRKKVPAVLPQRGLSCFCLLCPQTVRRRASRSPL